MSRLKQKIKDYFSFSPSETIGISILILLIIVILILPHIYYNFKKVEKINFSEFEKQIQKFDSAVSKVNDTTKFIHQREIGRQKTAFIRKQVFYSRQQSSYNNQKKQYFNKGYFVVEINSADSFALMGLKGIGYTFAKRIINYRNLLGGYCIKEQLLEVWGMDAGRYNLIKDHIEVNTDSIHKININKTSFKKLIKHPYFKYDIAVALTNYKKIYGEFKDIQDIKNCSAINDSVFERISPYIKVK
jgi:DNA uptake protein ComE-like DNA-binding protein